MNPQLCLGYSISTEDVEQPFYIKCLKNIANIFIKFVYINLIAIAILYIFEINIYILTIDNRINQINTGLSYLFYFTALGFGLLAFLLYKQQQRINSLEQLNKQPN